MMESTILLQPRLAPRSCAVVGVDAPTMAPRHRRRVEAHASRANGVKLRGGRTGVLKAAQWCPVRVVPELVASEPPAPDPCLAYLGKKDKFPSTHSLSRLKAYTPNTQHEQFGTSRILSLLSAAFKNITVLVPTSRPLLRPGHRQII
jgi:hypothetical protein